MSAERWRADFPILNERPHGKPLAYLDNAATTQKPTAVIEALRSYYAHDNANVHRAVHVLGARATEAYESARDTVRDFLGAADRKEIIFTRGTTEGINLVAQSLGRSILKPDDEVLLTGLEHHSNIVPWQLVCEATGARVVVAPVNDAGEIELEAFAELIGPRTRIAAFNHVSNAIGTVNPVERMIELCRAHDVITLIDGAQGVQHLPVDVQALGCDFYVFSGHKIYGPTGSGALYGRRERLESMPPWHGGGDMIRTVSFEGSTWAGLPAKFEAGTPSIAAAVGLAAALKYVEGIGIERIAAHEHALTEYALDALTSVKGLRLVGEAKERAGAISFVLDGVHPHDLATIVDHDGVAVRAGHHCAQPLMKRFGVNATARASLGLYNVERDVDQLVTALDRAREMFAA